MFISRKTVKLPTLKNKISNEQQLECQSAIDQLRSTLPRHRPETEVTRYPVFNILIAFAFLVLFVYLMYSVSGGSNSIPGFNERLWWQYLLSLSALLVTVFLLVFSEIESVSVSRQTITFSKKVMLGFYQWQSKERQLGELLGISIMKKGVERITFTNSSYVLMFNFKPYEQIEALECGSEITAGEYLEQLRQHLPQIRKSTQRISVKNIVVG